VVVTSTATLHAIALFFSKEESQNLDRQKAVRVARPLVKHELQEGGCLGMAATATFDEYCKAWLQVLMCNH
jgi:hypothetical protein